MIQISKDARLGRNRARREKRGTAIIFGNSV